MSPEVIILIAFGSFILGFALGALILRNLGKSGSRESELQNERDELRDRLGESQRTQAAAEARLQAAQEHHKAQIELLNDARNQLLSEFKASASQVMEQRQNQFRQDSSQHIGLLLKPLQDQIKTFASQIQEGRNRDAQERGFLKKELEQLLELNKQMSDDAKNLTDALKGNNKIMGTWGEVILKRVLESSGLEEGREYDLQKEFKSPEGSRFRPDAVLYLPDQRNIIIDSKVSLLSYERAFNAVGDQERDAHMAKHLESIRVHIKGLSGKDYQNLEGLNAPDFVLMFIPIEGALSAAQQAEPGLFQQAMDKQILLVSPTTLYLSLRIVEQMWKGDRQQRNARTIAVKAGALYDKFEGFLGDMQKIGDKLTDARQAWVQAANKLNTGRGNLIGRVQALKDMGAESNKEIKELDIKDDLL